MDDEKDLQTVKLHLRIDFDEDDESVKQMVLVAQSMLMGMIGSDDSYTSFYREAKYGEVFDLATLFLTDHFYKTRSATTSLSFHETPQGVQAMVLSLKPAYLQYINEFEEVEEERYGDRTHE